MDNADSAWRRLAASAGERSTRRGRIVGASNIAAALGVCEDTSRRYLRVFHALGLVDYERGYWNPAALEDVLAGFDGNNIGEDPGYQEWTDGLDFNDPATLEVKTYDPEAFVSAVTAMTRDIACELYVPRTHVETAGANGDLTRFARVGRPPEVYVSWWGEVLESPRGSSVSLSPQTTPYSSTAHGVDGVRHSARANGPGCWERVEAVAMLVVVPLPGPRRPPLTASEASTTRSLRSVFHETFSIPDLVCEYGWSRATANRRVKKWMESGGVERVGYGSYRARRLEGSDAIGHESSASSRPGRGG